ncbi:C1 family peptidase [Halobacteriovorax sp. RZ-1]|uniref:C1 family peptidase n=1 Tax=unclassified Halobacteriovorax TaxID=2639665 RepID=UPI003712A3A9
MNTTQLRSILLNLVILLGALYTQASELPSRSDIHALIGHQTSVKSQGSRGTCTMFSAIGIVEHLLIRKHGVLPVELDLSEQWMEYLIMKDKNTEGSTTSRNMRAILDWGVVHEKTWPYSRKKWPSLDEDYPEITMAKQACGHLVALPKYLKSCLLGQRDPRLFEMADYDIAQIDPDFIPIRKEAIYLRDTLVNDLYSRKKSYLSKDLSKIKKWLSDGKSVILGTKLYYGSWNSKKTETYEIQERDKSKWYAGIVGYPEVGTRDRRISRTNGGGHSMILVGYDDDIVVKTRMQMEDGSWQEFEYKGVYYFKNSWGVKGFGKRFKLDGVSYPGYGMITQKYAHDFGNFFYID